MKATKDAHAPISVVMIVKNEANNIRSCLEALQWADEIVVLDTGSEDNTIQICKDFGAKVFIQEIWEGFGKAKQAAVDLATHNWILSIDADEIVSPELNKEILAITTSDKAHPGYRIKMRTWFVTQWIDHCGWNKDYHLRLFKKQYGKFSTDLVHESVQVEGEIGIIETPLLHYSYPSIGHHQNKIAFYGKLWANDRLAKGKNSSLGDSIFHALWKFITMYFFQQGFRDGKAGLVLSINSAYSVYYKHLLLWELKQKAR